MSWHAHLSKPQDWPLEDIRFQASVLHCYQRELKGEPNNILLLLGYEVSTVVPKRPAWKPKTKFSKQIYYGDQIRTKQRMKENVCGRDVRWGCCGGDVLLTFIINYISMGTILISSRSNEENHPIRMYSCVVGI